MTADFKVEKAVGAGQMIFMLQPEGLPPLGSGTFEAGFPAGSKSINIKITLPEPQQNQKPLPSGTWTAKIMICQLTCGSPYKDAQTYGAFATQFTVVNSTSIEY